MSWPQVKLESVFEIARGGSPRPINDYITDADDGLNWISIKDASNSDKYIEKTKLKIKPEGLSKTRQVKPGDFLLTNSMSFGRPYIMKTTGCIHDGWLVLSGNPEKVDSDYIYHLLSSDLLKRRFSALAAGAVVKNLNIDLVKGVEIPLPPLAEQKRIAAILDKADAIRRKRQQATQLADEFLRSVFLDMFGDPVTNPKGWKVAKWCSVLTIVNGKNQKAVEDKNGTYPICGSGGFMAKANDWLTEANSVIIGRKGNINSPILMKERFWNVDTAFGLVPNRVNLSHNYLFWFCKFFDFGRLNKAVTIPSLTKADLLQVDITLPPIDLQAKFDEAVEGTDRLSEKFEKAASEQLFESLSQKAFSGEL